MIFSLIAAASNILALNSFTTNEVLVSSMFLIRFVAYFLLSQIIINLIKRDEILNWLKTLIVISIIFAIIGFLQIVYFPNLIFLQAYGWDPHQTRLVSTFLDPNFAGGFLVIVLAFSLSLFLKEKKIIYLIYSIVLFAAILLTFSRSSYLAALTVLVVIGFLKSPKLLLGFLAIAAVAFLTVTQIRARIIGAVTLDETSKARFESWQKAITIARENPILGVGFNTYRFAQQKAGYFSFDSPQGGHAGSGTDSSLLLVLATTGVIGLVAYMTLLLTVFAHVTKKAKKNIVHLGTLSALIGLLIHSQFVNSIFFPQIMLPFWFIVGLVFAES